MMPTEVVLMYNLFFEEFKNLRYMIKNNQVKKEVIIVIVAFL